VIVMEYEGRKILFTGDIESEAERRIVLSGDVGNFDVVKVPHHGSRTSSTEAFVDATRPHYALVPVGRRSVHGHPHPEVVERWRDAGAEVRTTGENGMITVIVTNGGIEILTFGLPGSQ
jgi:competence protein ComEC